MGRKEFEVKSLSGVSAVYGVFKQCKRIAAVAISAAVPMAANADTVTTNSVTWTYVVNDSTAKTVTLGDGSSNCIGGTGVSVDAYDIPWKFIGEADGSTYTVTEIAKNAFRDCSKLTGTLAFPSSVTSVGESAFESCTGLTALELGPNITTIGPWAFWSCSELKGTLAFPSSVTNVGQEAFKNCTGLTELELGPNINTIGAGAFYGCKNMVGDISDLTSVTSLGKGAFDGAEKLYGNVRFNPSLTVIPTVTFRYVPITSATLPESLTSIDELSAFGSTRIKSLWVKGSANVDLKYGFSDSPVEIFLAAPNTTCTNPKGYFFSPNAVCKVFIPATANWLQVDTSRAAGVDKIYYGADQDVDITVNSARNELTATVKTSATLVKLLEAAPLFREHFGLDTRISIADAIDLTGVTITDAMVSGVMFDRLMFSAKTQAQLNAILEVFPATTPISIDPTGLTENMIVPETYTNVHVKTVPGVMVKRMVDGFVIIVR